MDDEENTPTDAEKAAAEEVNRKGRERLAASRAKDVPHINKLRPPVTLYRMAGRGRAKRDRQWVASLDTLPTISGIQQQHGGGHYILVDPSGKRYAVTLADAAAAPATDPPSAHWSEGPRRAAEPPSAAPLPRYEPGHAGRFDPHTGRPVYAPPAPAFDPHTGRPVYAPPAPAFDPYTGRPVGQHWAAPSGGGGDAGMMGLILAELKSRREAPMPSASDFGGQAVDMMRALDHLEKLKNHFAPAPVADDGEDSESGLMGMLSQLLPLLMPAVGGGAGPAIAGPPAVGRIAAPAPAPAPVAAREPETANAGLQRWAAEPLNGNEVANVEQTLAVVGRWAPSITLPFLVDVGAEAGCTPRQSVYMFQKVFLEFLPGGGAAVEEGEEWSEEDEEWSEEDPQDYAPEQPAGVPPLERAATGPESGPVPLTLPEAPSNGQPLTPASQLTASGPSGSSPE